MDPSYPQPQPPSSSNAASHNQQQGQQQQGQQPPPPHPPPPSHSGQPVRRPIRRDGPQGSSSASGASGATGPPTSAGNGQSNSTAGLPPIHQLHPFLANPQQTYHAAQMQYYQQTQQQQQPPHGHGHGHPPPPPSQGLAGHPHPQHNQHPSGHHHHHPHQQQQQQQEQDYLEGDSEDELGESSTTGQVGAPGAPGPLPGEPVKKKRRRQALSCTECKRRKIRCDRQHPCGPCARRNEHDKCKWHVIEPVEKFVTRTEYDALKSTLGRLESMVSGMVGLGPGVPAGASLGHPPSTAFPLAPITLPAGAGTHPAANAQSLPTRFPPPPQVPNTPGHGHTASVANAHLQPAPQKKQDRIVAILSRVLPRKEVCDRLVAYYFKSLSAHHAVIHPKAFKHGYDLFWFNNPLSDPSANVPSTTPAAQQAGPGPAFVALLLVILCLALESVGPEEAIHSGFVVVPPRGGAATTNAAAGTVERSPSVATMASPSSSSDTTMTPADGDTAHAASASRRTQGEAELEKDKRRRDRIGKKEWGRLCAALWKGSKSVLGLTSSAVLGGAGAGGGELEDDAGGVGSSPLDLALAGTGTVAAGTAGPGTAGPGTASGVGLDVMQCLVLYSYCNQNLEQRGYEAQAPTLALAIRVAFSMGLARIPPDKPYHVPEPGVLKREISRRLFYTLLALDWHLSPSLGHTYLIHPNQFSVEEPLNLNFEELVEGKSLEPKASGVYTNVSGLLARVKVARRVRELTDKHNMPEGVRYDMLLQHESQLQEDAASLPKCLWSMDADLESSNPEVKWDRLNYMFAKHARTIRLHRPYLILGYRDARHRHSSDASVGAAEATLTAYDEARSAGMPGASWWMVNKYCFAASVVLLIDQYYVDRVDGPVMLLESRKKKIRNTVQFLRDISDISNFSKRAALLIDHLLVELDSPRYREAMSQQQIGQKRPSSPTPAAASREVKRARGDDAASRATPNQRGTPPVQQHATLSLLSSSLPAGVYLTSAQPTSTPTASPANSTTTTGPTPWRTGEDYLDAWISATGVEIPKGKPLTGLSGTSTPMIMGDLEDGFWRRVFDLDFEAPKDGSVVSNGSASTISQNVAPFAPVLGQVTTSPSPWLSGAATNANEGDRGGSARPSSSGGGSIGWSGPAAPVVHPMSEPTSWKTAAAAAALEEEGEEY